MDAVVSLLGLSPRYVGGSETYARELSQQLEAHGWKSILCFLEPPSDVVREYLNLPNVSIEIIGNAVEPNIQALRDCARILRRYRPRIFHMQLVGFIGFYPWLARMFGTRQVLFTDQGSHSSDYVPTRAPFWKRVLVRIINWPLSKVICVSRYNYKCFTARDVLPAERFEVIYNSADFNRLGDSAARRSRFRRKYGIPDDHMVIVQVSWIIPEKGITDLLEAASLVVKKNPKVHLVLAGEGNYRPEFTARANELGLRDHVTWTGLVTDPFSEGVYDAADIVCQVSRWQEAFGQTIAEAMACGKPVIGTRVGGIPELIEDQESGYVVIARDVEAIVDRILLLMNNTKLREEMGRKGYSIARARFNLSENVKRVLGLYGLSSQ
jgi:glycosyltransferase involved in cell wall biosynthesis